MKVLLLALVALAVIAFILRLLPKQKHSKRQKGELEDFPEVTEIDTECCGQHEICEKESLIAAVSQTIEYYDDEELDQFIGYTPEEYTSEQADLFRDVFYTMLDTDVAGWVRSLQHRGQNFLKKLKMKSFSQ